MKCWTSRGIAIWSLSLLFVAQLLWAGRVDATEPIRLRVLCYNIHYGQGNDGRYDVDRLAKVIASHKPDLVALQEVDVGVKRSGRVHQLRELGRLTKMSSRYGPTQHYQGGLYGNAVLSKLPIVDVEIQPLPYTASSAALTTYPRGAIAVTVRAANGKEVQFVSTHFQHNVAEDRVAEAKRINELFGKDKTPTILAGDMNAQPDSEPIAVLQEAWRHTASADFAPTAPATNARSRIDYIFFSKRSPFKVVKAEVIQEKMASDHLPVLTELELSP